MTEGEEVLEESICSRSSTGQQPWCGLVLVARKCYITSLSCWMIHWKSTEDSG